jgi:hypothetical protein
VPPEATGKRDTAQTAFVKYIMEKKKVVPLLVARFIGRQVAVETQKMLPNPSSLMHTSDIPEAEGGEYSLYDHIERLRYLEMSTEKKEVTLVKEVLRTALPGLEDFVTDERYAMLLGKMAYNSYGVCFGGGRDNRVGDLVFTLGVVFTANLSASLRVRKTSKGLVHLMVPKSRLGVDFTSYLLMCILVLSVQPVPHSEERY